MPSTVLPRIRARAERLGESELYYQAAMERTELAPGLGGLPDARPNTWIDVSRARRARPEALRLHGRHVADARERASELQDDPPTEAPLHRAWPTGPPGATVRAFLKQEERSHERGGRSAGQR
jgi:hypothetical protein